VAAASPDASFARVGLVGVGTIGGSIAAAAAAAWPGVRVVGVDRPEALRDAAGRGWVHETRSRAADLADVDLVVLATPVPHIIETIAELGRLGTRAIVTDVGSTKRRIVSAAASSGLATFVGGHPMAGSEGHGLAHARRDLFAGRPWLVVPNRSREDLTARVESFARGLGAVPRRIDAESHDRVIAYVSHLPQMLAVALMNVVGDAAGAGGLAMAGPALADMTRLSASPADLWQGILESNGDHVGDALAQFGAALDALRRALPDPQAIADAFGRAARHRAALQEGRR
jgi:prephenate dehydrogenase